MSKKAPKSIALDAMKQWPVVLVRLGDLNPAPYNPRTDAMPAQLDESMKRFGVLQPVVFNRRNHTIIGGHKRYWAMRQAAEAEHGDRWGEVNIQAVAAELDEADEKAANIALNKIGADPRLWDIGKLGENFVDLKSLEYDLSVTGWATSEVNLAVRAVKPLEQAEVAPPATSDGEADPEPPEAVQGPDGPSTALSEANPDPTAEAKPVTRTGDVWIMGRHRVMCGDSVQYRHVARLMDGVKAKFGFTSPPYADQRKYGGGDLSPEHLAKFIGVWHEHVDGMMAVNLGLVRKDHELIPYWDHYTAEAKAAGWLLLSWNVWDRGQPCTVGHRTAVFPIEHEWVMVYGSSRVNQVNLTVPNESSAGKIEVWGRRVNDKAVIDPPKVTAHYRPMGTVVRGIRAVHGAPSQLEKDHPARFPVELPATYMEACTQPGEITVDPFMGSGTTLIAAEQIDRVCYGMEIHPPYVDLICRRWVKLTGHSPVRHDGVKFTDLVAE